MNVFEVLLRRAFDSVQAAARSVRARLLVPDRAWREACTRHGVPLDRVRLESDGSLSVRFDRATLAFPPTPGAQAVVGAYAALRDLDAFTDCLLAWDRKRDGLRLAWGTATYFADCVEEVNILTELYLAGDYDLWPAGPAVVVDVGANVGFTSIFLADSNPGLMVEGYEPLRLSYEKAVRNLEENPHLGGRVRLFPCGLFSEDGEKTIVSAAGSRGMSTIVPGNLRDARTGSVETERVTVKRASEVVREVQRRHPGRQVVLKVDCEGSEYAIFGELERSGALAGIAGVVMEWHRLEDGGREIEALRDLLVAGGFHVCLRGRTQHRLPTGMAVAFRA